MNEDKEAYNLLQALSEDDKYKICDAFRSQCYAYIYAPYSLVFLNQKTNRFEIYEVIPSPIKNPEGLSRAEIETLGWGGRWKFGCPYAFQIKIVSGRYRNKTLSHAKVSYFGSASPTHRTRARGWGRQYAGYRINIDGQLVAMRKPQGQVFKLNLLHSFKAVQ